ncbi:uncharacterized protein RHO17_013155 isoform 3-T3 [Thomomys bottae]
MQPQEDSLLCKLFLAFCYSSKKQTKMVLIYVPFFCYEFCCENPIFIVFVTGLWVPVWPSVTSAGDQRSRQKKKSRHQGLQFSSLVSFGILTKQSSHSLLPIRTRKRRGKTR